MSDVLGKKQKIKNEAWIDALNNIEKTFSKKQLDTLVKQTVKEIKKITDGKKTAFAWSGGKDSLVLKEICYMADIKDCVLVTSDLEYKAFLNWINENKPDNLTIINTGQNLKWLSENQNMLFPQDSKTAAKWFQIVQHRGQAKYYKENSLDMILLGRRRADGNYVGKGANIYTNNQGITRYSPLSDWSHEAILAYMHYYKLNLPPIYKWKNGYTCGTHSWPARQWTGSVENGWREVYDIDNSIVIEASEYIPSAKAFLETI